MACNLNYMNRFTQDDYEVVMHQIMADEAIIKVHIYFEDTQDAMDANIWLHGDEASGDVLVTLNKGQSIFAFNDQNTAFNFKLRFG